MAETDRRPNLLGNRAEAGTGPRGGFSRRVRTPRPSLNRTPERSIDSISPALKMGAAIAEDTYTANRAERVADKSEQVAEVTQRLNNGQLTTLEANTLERADRTFAKYFNAIRQGAMTDTAANIAVESELKRVANQFPGLGPQVRQRAAQRMGFDPTGTEREFMVAPNQPSERSELPIEKDLREAELVAQMQGVDPQRARQRVLRNYRLQQDAQALEYQQSLGAASSEDAVNLLNIKALRDVEGMRMSLARGLRDNGVTDIGSLNETDRRAFVMQARQMRDQALIQARESLVGSGITGANLDARMDNISKRYNDFINNLDSFSTTEVLNSDLEEKRTRTNAMIMGQDPRLAVAEIVAGPGGNVSEVYESLLNPDNPIYQIMANNNPVLSSVRDQFGDDTTMGQALGAIWSGDSNRFPAEMSNRDRRNVAEDGAAAALANPAEANVRTANGRAGANAYSLADELGGAEIITSEIADNPAKYANRPDVLEHLRSKTGETALRIMAQQIVSESPERGPVKFRLDRNGNIAADIPEGAENDSVGRVNPRVTQQDTEYMKYSNSSWIRQYGDIGRALDNERMAQNVGLTKQQLVTRMNKYIQESVEGRAPTASTNQRMAPVSESQTRQIAEETGVDPEIFTSLIRAESNMGRSSPVSSAGALGPAQFMPATAAEAGLKVPERLVALDRKRINSSGAERREATRQLAEATRSMDLNAENDERLDSDKALRAGATYLREQIDRFDSTYLGVAAYNAGAGTVDRVLNGEQDRLPSQTDRYVEKITGTRGNDFINMYRENLRTAGY